MRTRFVRFCLCALLLGLSACAPKTAGVKAVPAPGDQIVVCGQRFSIGTPVVLWTDPGGFDAYPGGHFNDRLTKDGPNAHTWTLPKLRRQVDQVVIHYDAAGTSRRCFQTLEKRGLSCHFMLDVDGTIYQTLDLKERAWHATIANSRSVGIEIAQIGAYTDRNHPVLRQRDEIRMTERGPDGMPVLRERIPQPAPDLIAGRVQGQLYYQKPFTEAQYDALAKLLAGLNRVLPAVRLDYPKQASVLSPEELESWRGLIGHYHITVQKIDPGPAFDWDRVVREAALNRR